MATEKQIAALEKWLQVDIEDLDFDVCSEYLDRLHTASADYNRDRSKKGIVKQTKDAILDELRKAGKITRPAGEQTLPLVGPGDVGDVEAAAEEDIAKEEKEDVFGYEAEISKIAYVMSLAAKESEHIVDELANGGGITEGTKASLVERFAVTIFIEAMKRGL